MTANSNLSPAAQALLTARASKGKTAPKPEGDSRHYLADALSLTAKTAPEGMTRQDVDMVKGAAQVLAMDLASRLGEVVKAVGRAKVDPKRVTLRHDGSKVTANLSIPVTHEGRTFYVNVNVSDSDGIGAALAPMSERVAKRGK